MEKINVAELLKDCQKGMELDCTMFENVTFLGVDMSRKQFPIEIAVGGVRSQYLTKEGCFHDTTLLPDSKCVIFPKGKISWEGFVPPYQFKDGDKIKRKGDTRLTTIKDIRDNCYIIKIPDFFSHAYITDKLLFSNQNEYELVPSKFDINTLKPFDKVLVRGGVGQKWTHDFFGFMDKDKGYPFVCVGHYVSQCIPYEGNQHLLGTTNDCDEYFKIWE